MVCIACGESARAYAEPRRTRSVRYASALGGLEPANEDSAFIFPAVHVVQPPKAKHSARTKGKAALRDTVRIRTVDTSYLRSEV